MSIMYNRKRFQDVEENQTTLEYRIDRGTRYTNVIIPWLKTLVVTMLPLIQFKIVSVNNIQMG